MANWMLVDLAFDAPPSAEALALVNAYLQGEDYDAPKLTAEGWQRQPWRGPTVDPESLPALFASFGMLCRARAVQAYRGDWNGADAESLAACKWTLSPGLRLRVATLSDSADVFERMGGTWSGEDVAKALRLMGEKR